MKERPILFNGDMVRAILDGRKTQTRRPIHKDIASVIGDDPNYYLYRCPFGQAGDRLWVRETWMRSGFDVDFGHQYITYCSDNAAKIVSLAIKELCASGNKIPSIHMPRWASRILLEITDVRIERVQDITEADANAEGCDNSESEAAVEIGWYELPRRAFRRVWDQCYSRRGLGWDANPWVWVIEFKIVEGMK